MMHYQDFIAKTLEFLRANINDDETIEHMTITKNNGAKHDGVIISSNSINIAPTIYLGPYYHRYLEGVPLEDIYSDIWETYRKHKPLENIDVSFYTDFEKVKDHIIYKLIHYEKNKELLDDCPFFRFQDLAIVFNFLLDATSENYATILIHTSHLSFWNIDEQELLECARRNTHRLLPEEFVPIRDIVSSILEKEDWDTLEDTIKPMYVLTNENRLNGACSILYDGILERISGELGSDLILIPSSIHEFLILPAQSKEELEEIHPMVQEVNDAQVRDEEVLSDHAYYYCAKTKLISY